jgi:uncharacterized membrane protein YkvA (DUF1232 family)
MDGMIYTLTEMYEGVWMGPAAHRQSHEYPGKLSASFWQDLRLAWRLYRDPRVPKALKTVVPVLVAAYLVSPIDLIPDVLLGIGQLDDLSMMSLALVLTVTVLKRLAPREIVLEHLAAMHRTRGNGERMSGNGDASGEIIEANFRVGAPGSSRSSSDRGRFSP